MDVFSIMVLNDASSGAIKGVCLEGLAHITHLLFIDDILLITNGSRRDALLFKSILAIFSKASGMVCNADKSSISFLNMDPIEELWFAGKYGFNVNDISMGLSYLGFLIKPNDYCFKD